MPQPQVDPASTMVAPLNYLAPPYHQSLLTQQLRIVPRNQIGPDQTINDQKIPTKTAIGHAIEVESADHKQLNQASQLSTQYNLIACAHDFLHQFAIFEKQHGGNA